MGKPSVLKDCLYCKQEFLTYPVTCISKHAKYCSRKCFGMSRIGIKSKNKKQLPKHQCLTCKNFFRAYRRCVNKYCSKKCNYIGFSLNYSGTTGITGRNYNKGPDNPNWKGGIWPLNLRIRESQKYKEWHKLCMKQDYYTCQNCKIYRKKIQVDHQIPFSKILETIIIWAKEFNIDPYDFAMKFEPLWDVSNGRVLCVDCHRKTNTWGRRVFNNPVIKNFYANYETLSNVETYRIQ